MNRKQPLKTVAQVADEQMDAWKKSVTKALAGTRVRFEEGNTVVVAKVEGTVVAVRNKGVN